MGYYSLWTPYTILWSLAMYLNIQYRAVAENPEDIFNLAGKKVLVTIEEDDTVMEESVESHSKKIKA